jgi:hypothetical protein
VSRLAWTDPVPLEVQRPRLPWWTMCARKLLWAVSPVILVVALVTALVFLGRRVWRYPLLVIGGTALAGLGIGYSWWAPIELLAAVAVGCGVGLGAPRLLSPDRGAAGAFRVAPRPGLRLVVETDDAVFRPDQAHRRRPAPGVLPQDPPGPCRRVARPSLRQVAAWAVCCDLRRACR